MTMTTDKSTVKASGFAEFCTVWSMMSNEKGTGKLSVLPLVLRGFLFIP
jgi:hypothetical protein